MNNDIAVEILRELWRYKTTDKYTEIEIRRALETAIEAVNGLRQHGEWIPITYRPMDEEEYEDFKKEFCELPVEDRKMFSCQMPEDDQEILVSTQWGGVNQDRCEIDEYGYALETQGDWDGVIAWMPLPKPYKKEGETEWKSEV